MTWRIVIPVVGFVLILGIGALAIWLYNCFYRKHVNRVLEDENADVGPAPAPRKIVSAMLICIGCGIICLSFMDKLHEINNNILAVQGNLSERISSLENSLSDQIQEQNSLFLSFACDTTDFDAASRSATVTFRAIPKEDNADTEISLSYNGKTVALLPDGTGSYIGSTQQPLFEVPPYDGTLCVTENGTNKYESVWFDSDLSARGFLPHISLLFEEPVLSQSDYTIHFEGQLYAKVSDPERIRSLHLLLKQKDEFLDDWDLLAQKPEGEVRMPLAGECSALSPASLVLRWEDCYGLIHESERFELYYGDGASGTPSITDLEEVYAYCPEQIYDTAGNKLGTLK